jgi:CzcA family heavy metal efflux pump
LRPSNDGILALACDISAAFIGHLARRYDRKSYDTLDAWKSAGTIKATRALHSMTWLVKVALERPLTFVVMVLLLLIFGPMAASRMAVDIFPNISIPVVGVAFQFTGLSPDEMAKRIITPYERILSTTVNDIEHTDSQSMYGIGTVKIYFQPNVDVRTATAQVTAISQTAIRQMPVGTQPPLILIYNASTVPVVQLALSSDVLSEQQVLDLSQNFVRPQLTTVQGAAIPFSYGGKTRQIQVDLDPQAMQADGLSATDVENALANQDQIEPVGTAKIGTYQYMVQLNNSAATLPDFNNLPVKTVNGATILMRDVGHVRDGFPPQQSIVHVDGARAVLSTVLKNGSASTLDVVQGVLAKLQQIKQQLPETLKISTLNDQSLFVKAAIGGVIREGTIAAVLTSLMVLLFLGSWRSTIIIALSIPLSVLCALIALWATGETLNIMTLGGLALAVGILVDDATVTIENINWHLEQGKAVKAAIMDGAHQIATPAFVSTFCICIVFIPMFSLPGVAGYLFVPMAASVVYALIASFVLSRTVVPTMAMYLLRAHAPGNAGAGAGPLGRLQQQFERGFESAREGYRNLLALTMENRRIFVAGFLGFVLLSFLLVPFLGSDFFPSVDAGQITLHVRPPVGTRVEDSTQLFGQVEADIHKVIPRNDLASIIDNLGLPSSAINMIYNNTGLIGEQDGDIYVSLNRGHRPTAGYVKTLRATLTRDFPGTTFSFPPADIVSQILNFGIPAPIDLQIVGPQSATAEAYGLDLLRQMRQIPGIVDARMQQSDDYPQLDFQADRVRMAQYGLTEHDVTNAMATALAGTTTTAPNFWIDPKTGVSYPIVAQTPEYRLDTLPALENLPVTPSAGGQSQILGALGKVLRVRSPAVVTHYNVLPSVDLYASTQERDLGAVANDVTKMIAKNKKALPRGDTVVLRGEVATMRTAFFGLYLGLAGAILLVYLLIVVNFQSWLDPFIIITALPAALAGIVWGLFSTGTTLSVPALTGAIMCMGVGTANSILVVSFARERLEATGDPIRSAIEAGFVRCRPVLMTALAMIIGMVPMALGLGEGGEQNAPLGRAVIGGLAFATVATLIFVPVVFSIVHGHALARRSRQAQRPGDVYA